MNWKNIDWNEYEKRVNKYENEGNYSSNWRKLSVYPIMVNYRDFFF